MGATQPASRALPRFPGEPLHPPPAPAAARGTRRTPGAGAPPPLSWAAALQPPPSTSADALIVRALPDPTKATPERFIQLAEAQPAEAPLPLPLSLPLHSVLQLAGPLVLPTHPHQPPHPQVPPATVQLLQQQLGPLTLRQRAPTLLLPPPPSAPRPLK